MIKSKRIKGRRRSGKEWNACLEFSLSLIPSLELCSVTSTCVLFCSLLPRIISFPSSLLFSLLSSHPERITRAREGIPLRGREGGKEWQILWHDLSLTPLVRYLLPFISRVINSRFFLPVIPLLFPQTVHPPLFLLQSLLIPLCICCSCCHVSWPDSLQESRRRDTLHNNSQNWYLCLNQNRKYVANNHCCLFSIDCLENFVIFQTGKQRMSQKMCWN